MSVLIALVAILFTAPRWNVLTSCAKFSVGSGILMKLRGDADKKGLTRGLGIRSEAVRTEPVRILVTALEYED